MSFKYNSGGAKPSQFAPVPAGQYALIITDVEEKYTKNNDDMVNLTCIIDGGMYSGQKIWHRVCFLKPESKGVGIALHFLKTIGQPFEGEFNVDSKAWIGSRFLADVILTESPTTMKPRNEVDAVYPVSDGKTKVQLAQKSSSGDESVPF